MLYSGKKNRYKEKWGENTSGEPDYNTRLEQGHYDDGVAIICGQLRRGPNKDKWISCFDFDSKEAFDTFCDIFGTTLEQLAKWTLVEWHGSPERIHVFFITDTPFKNILQVDLRLRQISYWHLYHLLFIKGGSHTEHMINLTIQFK